MIGDARDIAGRLRAALPLRWFGDESPVLDALLAGDAAGWTWLHGLVQGLRRQTRIASADGDNLELASADFFGDRLRRGINERDVDFRARIMREMFRPRATRSAMAAQLAQLSGSVPSIFEPARPADTGVWNQTLGWGVAGGWGSLRLPGQSLIRVRNSGAASVSQLQGAAAVTAPVCGVAWLRVG